jgi:hypothetical protein
MKKTLIALALLASFGASFAQSADSNSGSASNSGAISGSQSGVQSSNSGNTTAIGNENASRSQSGSNSGASSGSMSGAMGNAVTLNQNVPSVQNINQTGTSSSSSTSTNSNTQMMGGGTNNTDNVKYSGVIENRSSGGTYNVSNENVHYSGTQTIKNVPGIAMSGPASGPCTGNSGGIGVAGPGFGVGLNGAKVDDGCTVRENTRILGQLYQSLDAANPGKAEAQAALLEGMAIIRNMNAKIGGDYAPPAPKQQAKAEVAPAVAQAVPAPALPAVQMASTDNAPADPYIRSRMGLPPLK